MPCYFERNNWNHQLCEKQLESPPVSRAADVLPLLTGPPLLRAGIRQRSQRGPTPRPGSCADGLPRPTSGLPLRGFCASPHRLPGTRRGAGAEHAGRRCPRARPGRPGAVPVPSHSSHGFTRGLLVHVRRPPAQARPLPPGRREQDAVVLSAPHQRRVRKDPVVHHGPGPVRGRAPAAVTGRPAVQVRSCHDVLRVHLLQFIPGTQEVVVFFESALRLLKSTRRRF